MTIFAYYWAWNTVTNKGEPSDVDNHTIIWSKDGVEAPVTNLPELTTQAGLYKVELTADESACTEGILLGQSSTANITIIGTQYLLRGVKIVEFKVTEVRNQ